ncbi:unnamed protein product [Mycena citricolor]|uniref:Chitobiosyldiphosphodolichol beta-mannosyltransferase n=1 Tax=Mycena citricolor TaxID=2018698 RepID=A0AAD2HRW3_9AGAR|nr:unnamed protein product [Mycena citricolor]
MFPPDYLLLLLSRLLVSVFVLWLSARIWRFFTPREQHSLRTVAIVVLGDLGRSPRMMNHAESFAENGFFADVICYGGSAPIPSLNRPEVKIRQLPEPPRPLRALPFLLSAPVKIVLQILGIFVELFTIPNPPEFILVQNPPSIPTLAIVQTVCYLRGSKLIIDWHNLGYSILALRFPKAGEKHPLVRLAKWFESTFGRHAYAHLFVTNAMRDHLVKQWNLQGIKVVLHDRPPRRFHATTPQEVHEDFSAQPCLQGFLPASKPAQSTFMTATSTGASNSPTAVIDPIYSHAISTFLRPDRPALLVSSTSWTPDEDFGILLSALTNYNQRAAASAGNLPKLVVVVTGKGPLREKYMSEINDLQRIGTGSDALDLLELCTGSADLGICLHASSSNLDLPMKVVDMFGCRLPVCALGFDCLNELVKDNQNGLIFKDAAQLAEQIEILLTGFPNCPRLDQLRSALEPASERPTSPSHLPPLLDPTMDIWEPWDMNWARHIKPLILKDVRRDGL